MGLKLTPEQQSSEDRGIRMDQWTLGKTQPSQPFNDLLRCLITSISTQRQANAILQTLVDCMVDHKLNLCHVLATNHKPAFMPRDMRDHFKFDPVPLVIGDLNPNYHGLLFPDTGLEKPNLASFMDSVPEEVRGGILHCMKEVHTRNMEKV